uniref:ATP-binding protein n=2 Tax=Leeia oryzae TaxID=356662 RepID=UPI0003720F3F|nr:ATP-binding protein [Leeia oryzae]
MNDLLMQDILSQLTRIADALAPAPVTSVDWNATAFRWRKRGQQGFLQAIAHPHKVTLSSLQNIEPQKAQVLANTRQFVAGKPANNVLLTGGRGTGKSSLIKAMLNEFSAQGLRLVEIDKADLIDLADLVEQLYDRPERFIVFCDDLSFDEGDASYKALKTALDGTVSAPGENVLIYATSNRRHLLPEYFEENAASRKVGEEIHPAEVVDDKIALSERFGLWLSFYPFSQPEYLAAVSQWLSSHGLVLDAHNERLALQWAQARGGRSGRIAWQFARDLAGKQAKG